MAKPNCDTSKMRITYRAEAQAIIGPTVQTTLNEELVESILVPTVFHDWKKLGKKLQFKDKQIEEIESLVDQADCSNRCYSGVFHLWLDGKPFTTEHVLQLEKALVEIGETETAKKLKKVPLELLIHFLIGHASKWMEIGLELGIPHQLLQEIHAQAKKQQCLWELLHIWLERKHRGQSRRLIEGLQSLNYHQEAESIEKYLDQPFLKVSVQVKDREEKQQKMREVLQRALKDGSEEVSYVRVMFIGPSGVGKSSLLHGLMGKTFEPANTNSTLLAVAHNLKNGWAKTDSSHKSKKCWCYVTEEDEIHELAVLIHKIKVENRKFRNTDRSSQVSPSPPPESTASVRAQKVPSKQRTKKHKRHKESKSNVFLDEMKEILGDLQLKVVEEACNLAESPNFVSASKPDVLQHVWDCGGQPVYLDALQPFLSSHTMFLLLYNAADGLDSTVKSVWYENGNKTDCGDLQVTVLDQLDQWMAAIHANLYKKSDVTSPPEGVPLFPRIMLVGTHGDIPGVNATEVIQQLDMHCDGKAFNDLVVCNTILDNARAGKDDQAFSNIREKIENFAISNLTLDTPVAWVLFRKILSKLAENHVVISYEKVCAIAKSCEILECDVSHVLSFYHELGVFFFYSEVPELCKVVFADPKWLVKQLAKLLTINKYADNPQITKQALRTFSKYGILIEDLYKQVWKEIGVDQDAIISLLKHYLLLVPVSETPPTVASYSCKSYFLPAMLPLYKESNAKPSPPALQSTDPFCLAFSTKYLPPGFFVRLVAVLAHDDKFKILYERNLFRNSACFFFSGNTDIVKLTAKLTHVEITVTREVVRHRSNRLFVDVCHDLLKLIYASSITVCNLFSGIFIVPALLCHSSEAHSAFCYIKLDDPPQKSDETLRCIGGSSCYAKPDQQFWLTIPDNKEECNSELSDHEICGMLGEHELQMERCTELLKAVEVANVPSEMSCKENVIFELNRWSKEMKGRGRQLLTYHLNRLGMTQIANKLSEEHYQIRRHVPPLPSETPQNGAGGSFPPEPKLKDLVLLKINDWYSLGLQLDIEDSKLDEIQKESNNNISLAKRMMFQHWLQNDTDANKHEKLKNAIELVESPKVAKEMVSKLMK